MPTHRVGVLGPVVLYDTHGEPVPVPGTRKPALLAMMTLRRGRAVSTEVLAHAVWRGDPPTTARSALRVHLADLRRLLAGVDDALSAAVVTESGGYRLDVDAGAVDAGRFEALLARARDAADPDVAFDAAARALGLWRGAPYPELADTGLAVGEVGRLDQLRTEAVVLWADAGLRSDRATEVIGLLDAEWAQYRFHEDIARLLMMALYLCGRQADALAVFDQTRRALVEELGIEPGPDLRRVERAILDHDESLSRAAPVVAGRSGPALIGRQRELAVFDALLGRDDAAGVVLIAGPPGIGKTRLVDAVVARSGRLGVWGHCPEDGTAVPLWPVSQWLAALADAGVGAAGDLDSELQALDPVGAPGADVGRRRLVRRVVEVVHAAASRRPLLLILDDAHAADAATLACLSAIAQRSEARALLVIVTVRDTPGDMAAHVPELLAHLRRLSSTRELVLEPFTEDDTRDYVRSMSGSPDPFSSDDVEWLHRRSAGNPLFLEHLVRWSERDVDVPPGIADLVAARTRRLADVSRRLLDVAAACGRTFPLPVVARAAECSAAQLTGFLDAVVALGLVEPDPDGSGSFRFVHAVVRDAIYAAIGETERRGAHDAIADALETPGIRHRFGHALELAHHRLQAVPVGSASAAVAATIAAGRRAMGVHAHADAVRILERGESALDWLTADERDHGLELMSTLGDALVRAGRPEEAWTVLEDVAEAAERAGDAERLAVAAILQSRIRSPAGAAAEHDRVTSRLADARSRLGADVSSLRVRVLDDLAMTMYLTDQVDERTTLAAEATEVARRLDDPSLLANALCVEHMASASPDNLTHRLAVDAEAIRLAQAGRDPEPIVVSRLLHMASLIEAGDIHRADVELAAAQRAATELCEPRYMSTTHTWRAMFEANTGRLDAAERELAAALEVWAGPASADAAMAHAIVSAWVRRLRGAVEELIPMTAALVAERPDLVVYRANLAFLCADAGRDDQARRELEALLDEVRAASFRDVTWLATVTTLAETMWVLRDGATAGELAEMLAPYRDRHVVVPSFGGAGIYRGSVAHHLGLLDHLLGDLDGAARWLDEALVSEARHDLRPWVARSQIALAAVLADRGDGRSADRALSLVEAASSTIDEIGAEGLRSRLSGLGEAWR